MMIDLALAILAAALGLVTLLPFSTSEVWWVRGWDFPRLQLAAVSLVVTVLTALRLEPSSWLPWSGCVVSGLCFVYQTGRILPYTPLWNKEVKSASAARGGRSLRILASNVLISNRDADRLLALVREHDPDVMVTLESDAWWERALRPLERDYPHRLGQPLANAYGMHVFSRLRMEDAAVEFLVEKDVPSMHATLVLGSGERVRVHFLHPAPPSPTENPRSTERDAELVIVAKRVTRETGPIVVTGDLNDVAWSRTTRLFRKISRLLDPRIGRGMFNTFNARWPGMRWPLDHVFHSDHFRVVKLERLGAIGSDHFPILIELLLDPRAEQEQEAPRANSGDEELAEKKLREVGRSAAAKRE